MNGITREKLQQVRDALAKAIKEAHDWCDDARGTPCAEVADCELTLARLDAHLSESGFDECVASGQSCRYGPHGPKGKVQCEHCGKEKPDALQAAAQAAFSHDDMIAYGRLCWRQSRETWPSELEPMPAISARFDPATPPAGQAAAQPVMHVVGSRARGVVVTSLDKDWAESLELAGQVPLYATPPARQAAAQPVAYFLNDAADGEPPHYAQVSSEYIGTEGVFPLYATPPAGERSPEVPQGWKLLKDSTHEERSWREDAGHENGNYSNACCECGRMFLGHKRRVICKVCSAHGAGERSTPAEPSSWVEAEEKNTPLWQACVRAAKVTLETVRYMREQKRHQQIGAGGFGYHPKTQECGFAAAIYKEIVATPPSPQPKEGEQP